MSQNHSKFHFKTFFWNLEAILLETTNIRKSKNSCLFNLHFVSVQSTEINQNNEFPLKIIIFWLWTDISSIDTNRFYEIWYIKLLLSLSDLELIQFINLIFFKVALTMSGMSGVHKSNSALQSSSTHCLWSLVFKLSNSWSMMHSL